MMMKSALVVTLIASLVCATVASAHPAPTPRSFETRLLADCNDDISKNEGSKIVGYDLHSLDIWEFWNGQTEMIGFRAILNGEGPGNVTVTFNLQDNPIEVGWTSSDGMAWTHRGLAGSAVRDDVFIDEQPPANDSAHPKRDLDRFALVGWIPASQWGGTGATLGEFSVTSNSTNGVNDTMPGYDSTTGECERAQELPDYVLGRKSVQTGYLEDLPGNALLTLVADEEFFFDILTANRIATLDQEVSLSILSATGEATVQFHEPGGDYADNFTFQLGSRDHRENSDKLTHLALAAGDGDVGTVEVEITTKVILLDGTHQDGGRLTRTIRYEVGDATIEDVVVTRDQTDDNGNRPSSSLALPILSVVLLAGAAMRRQ